MEAQRLIDSRHSFAGGSRVPRLGGLGLLRRIAAVGLEEAVDFSAFSTSGCVSFERAVRASMTRALSEDLQSSRERIRLRRCGGSAAPHLMRPRLNRIR